MQADRSHRPTHGGNLVWAADLAGCPAAAILDFSASINPLGPPQSALEAIQAHLTELRHYPDPDYRELRQVLSQQHNLSPEWVMPGNGAAELLTWASRDLAKQAATYLLTPAFSDYFRALKSFGAKLTAQPLKLQADAPHLLIPAPPGSGLLLNNPHNPSGRLFPKTALLPLLHQFALVVIDEAFMDFLPPDQQQSLIDWVPRYPNLVILRSLTKFYSLPGLRLGYAIAHPDRLARWQTWRDPWSVNSLAAAAGVAILQDQAFQQQTWDWLPPARQQLMARLAALPGLAPLPSSANFLLVQCQGGENSASGLSGPDLQQRLLKSSQILIRDCLSFPELGEAFFRVAVRQQVENQRLLDGLAAALANGAPAGRGDE
ncbi:MAG: threonine-phosphate decarboxylase CobD [Elainella sp.]